MIGPDERVDLAVVGGGAAGLTAAIFAARLNPALRIAVFDGAKKLGAKILISGGGRCNVTNAKVTAADFHSPWGRVVAKVLEALPVSETIKFFADLGVALHEEERGKLFPDSNDAKTVVNALLAEADRRGVRISCNSKVTRISSCPHSPPPAQSSESLPAFTLETDFGPCHSRAVILACGGQSLPKTGSDGGGYLLARSLGHSVVPTVPALVPLILEGDFHIGLAGLSLDVELAVRMAETRLIRLSGPMLWTHFGISGPVVLDASRHWTRARQESRQVSLTASFIPGMDFTRCDAMLQELARTQSRVRLHNAMASRLPARMTPPLLRAIGLDPDLIMAHLSRESRRKLVHALLEWALPVRGDRGYNHAEVTAGGVPLDEISPQSMESRPCRGLYLVGEVLDVDGRIGGFNFQWAWSSGFVAGRAVAHSLGQSLLASRVHTSNDSN